MKKQYDLTYDGQTGEVYKIWLLNLILSILTLGIYRFWGKARMRRYMTAGFSLGDDRFEYTGTGGELFWGFLKALFFVMIFLIPFFWSVHEMGKMSQKLEQQLEQHLPQQPLPQEKPTTSSPQEPPAVVPQPEPMPDTLEGNGSSIAPISSSEHSHIHLTMIEEQEQQVGSRPSQSTQPSQFDLEELIEKGEIGAYEWTVLGIYFGYIFFFVLVFPPIAMYQAIKYRASRLRFRGIRGHLVGSSLKYGIVALIHGLLILITVGLWKPIADLMLYQYKMKRLYFGSQKAHFKAPYLLVFLNFFMYYLCIIVGAFCMFSSQAHTIMANMNAELPVDTATITAYMPILTTVGAVLLVVGLIGLVFGYRAYFDRVKFNKLTFGDIGFRCTITGWRLFKFYFINLLWLVLTLGLAFPYIMQRHQRFLSRNLKVDADLENTNIFQASGKEDQSGEGLLSFFDLKIRLF